MNYFLNNQRFIKFYTLIAAAFLLALAAEAQDLRSYRGQVQDALTHEPLVGASLRVEGSRLGTATDENGRFLLSRIPADAQVLVVRFVGYQPQRINLDDWPEDDLIFLVEQQTTMADVVVSAPAIYPVTKSELKKEDIQPLNLAQDLPILLRFTPSLVTTSDAGAGVGYTAMRIRGSDATRTNVTINGIPLNDAESQGVFWVNMPDFASSVSQLQIQRGVGTSVNGAGAFGASLNIQTEGAGEEAFAEIGNSYGSFNTWRHSVQFGTGTIADKFRIAGRLSKITSDGFIDRAFSDLKSFFVTGTFADRGHELTANIFSGQEQTYQAWYGVPEERIQAGDRTYNAVDYENEIDNYQQDHYQLIYNNATLFDGKIGLNAALHYTYGRGYFEQFREQERLSRYGLEPILIGDERIERTDLIRRRWLDNDFYGALLNLTYQSDRWQLHWGGSWNRYAGKHFGEIIWAQFAAGSQIRERYYDNDATKTDANTFLKATYEATQDLFLFADLQLRHVDYTFLGFDNEGRNVTQTDKLTFVNPKAGLRYLRNDHQWYASYALGQREPNRDDYTESSPESRPRPEQLHNVEAGYAFGRKRGSFFANLFYMYYRDQLVLTGAVNDVGAYTRQNIRDSYRAGLELGGSYQIGKLHWQGNLSWSQNKIRRFAEFLDDFDNGGQIQINHQNTDIAFSPAWVAASQATFHLTEGLEIGWMSKYVGRQYLDNTQNAGRQLPAYWVQDARLTYRLPSKIFSEARINLLINNLFNLEYSANGYTFGYIAGGEVIYENFFYPQAGTHFLLGIDLRW
ncbi:MAG: TonB-dependent receptor [Bernardetiaceae bacterium]